MRKASRYALVVLPLTVGVFFVLDLEPTPHYPPPAVEPGPDALRIHHDAIVIDLHVDSLLWPRDLSRDGPGGHVDFPRMREGGLDAAAFTLPTQFFGAAGLKAFHDLWPPTTWFSPWERLRYQLQCMTRWVERSGNRVQIARTAAEVRGNHDQGILSVFHGIEGAHALGTDLSRVETVAREGILFIAPVHLADNAYGGSSGGSNRGLSDLGRELIQAMNREGLLIDLAHSSPATFEEALALTSLPPLVSHIGARAVHDTSRNLSDDQIRLVAERGGVIGVMLAPPATSRPDLHEVIAHLRHIIAVGGEDTPALGSDYDGYVETPIDVTGLPQLTQLMLDEGWSEEKIRKVLGENFLRVLRERERDSDVSSQPSTRSR
jgi:microsomal dipeptidase-like Zn-dependent dipeptidase